MKISVTIPSYKPQYYLWECLDSLYNQTLPKNDYEVILVLNGCNEPYNSQIRQWINSHTELKVNYIQANQGGVSNARNLALDVAKGEYITFMDDDDYVSNNYLKALLEKADSETISLAYPFAFNEGDNKQLPYRITEQYRQLLPQGKIKASKARKFFSGPWMKLIPMSFIQDRRFNPNFKVGEDSLFMYSISDRFKYVECADESAVYYRRYRKTGAISKKRNTKEILRNNFKMQKTVLSLYFSHISQYSFVYTILTLTSIVKGGIVQAFIQKN